VSCAGARPASDPAPVTAADDDPDDATPGHEGDDSNVHVVGAPPSAGNAGVALLAEVDRELAHRKSGAYAHHTHVDEAAGEFDYDCSGFLVYALSRAAPDALAAVNETTTRRPRSSELVAFLLAIPVGAAKGRWQRVARVQDLAPGDVITWLKPAGSRSTNTGHTMIVHGALSPIDVEPGAFVVPVVDSTARPHAPGDARSTEHRTGLGQGEIVLVADESGAPIRYRWSRGDGSRAKTTTIALGRLR
jgi:hypothetical protein